MGNREDDEKDDIAITTIFCNAFKNPTARGFVLEEGAAPSFEETLAQDKATHTKLPIREPPPLPIVSSVPVVPSPPQEPKHSNE